MSEDFYSLLDSAFSGNKQSSDLVISFRDNNFSQFVYIFQEIMINNDLLAKKRMMILLLDAFGNETTIEIQDDEFRTILGLTLCEFQSHDIQLTSIASSLAFNLISIDKDIEADEINQYIFLFISNLSTSNSPNELLALVSIINDLTRKYSMTEEEKIQVFISISQFLISRESEQFILFKAFDLIVFLLETTDIVNNQNSLETLYLMLSYDHLKAFVFDIWCDILPIFPMLAPRIMDKVYECLEFQDLNVSLSISELIWVIFGLKDININDQFLNQMIAFLAKCILFCDLDDLNDLSDYSLHISAVSALKKVSKRSIEQVKDFLISEDPLLSIVFSWILLKCCQIPETIFQNIDNSLASTSPRIQYYALKSIKALIELDYDCTCFKDDVLQILTNDYPIPMKVLSQAILLFSIDDIIMELLLQNSISIDPYLSTSAQECLKISIDYMNDEQRINFTEKILQNMETYPIYELSTVLTTLIDKMGVLFIPYQEKSLQLLFNSLENDSPEDSISVLTTVSSLALLSDTEFNQYLDRYMALLLDYLNKIPSKHVYSLVSLSLFFIMSKYQIGNWIPHFLNLFIEYFEYCGSKHMIRAISDISSINPEFLIPISTNLYSQFNTIVGIYDANESFRNDVVTLMKNLYSIATKQDHSCILSAVEQIAQIRDNSLFQLLVLLARDYSSFILGLIHSNEWISAEIMECLAGPNADTRLYANLLVHIFHDEFKIEIS